jgi:hypothetical protein
MSQIESGWGVLVRIDKLLKEKGVDVPNNLTRIIVDIPVDGVCKIYYETLGDNKTIDVIMNAALDILDVKIKDKQP